MDQNKSSLELPVTQAGFIKSDGKFNYIIQFVTQLAQ